MGVGQRGASAYIRLAKRDVRGSNEAMGRPLQAPGVLVGSARRWQGRRDLRARVRRGQRLGAVWSEIGDEFNSKISRCDPVDVATNAACVATVGRSATGAGMVSACDLATNPGPLARMNVAAYAARRKKLIVIPVDEEDDDVQVRPVGTPDLNPLAVVVAKGPNGVIDTPRLGDDIEFNFLWWRVICAGWNGVAESAARTNNTVVSLPFAGAEMSNYFNRIYAQAVVEWDVDVRPAVPFNYDRDRDRICLVPPDGLPPSSTDEHGLLCDHFLREAPGPDDVVLVVIPTQLDGPKVLGKAAGVGRRVAVVEHNATNFLAVCAHEVGHCLGLKHPRELNLVDRPPLRRCLMWDALLEMTGSQLHVLDWARLRMSFPED